MITQEYLKNILDYNPDTGYFIWKISTNGHKANRIAGYYFGNGYVGITINQKKYLAHRLAWLYYYGHFPSNFIDHINQIKDDNRISNLREATKIQNSRNRNKQQNNTSGYKGVCWHKKNKKWMAQINIPGKCIYLGLYENILDAQQAYKDAAMMYYGEFNGG